MTESTDVWAPHRTGCVRGRPKPRYLAPEVVKHPMAKRGFVLVPRGWVVEKEKLAGSDIC